MNFVPNTNVHAVLFIFENLLIQDLVCERYKPPITTTRFPTEIILCFSLSCGRITPGRGSVHSLVMGSYVLKVKEKIITTFEFYLFGSVILLCMIWWYPERVCVVSLEFNNIPTFSFFLSIKFDTARMTHCTGRSTCCSSVCAFWYIALVYEYLFGNKNKSDPN